jgi:SAM-dependent methyltransferase
MNSAMAVPADPALAPAPGAVPAAAPAGRRLSVLVAIASYGTAQDHFLHQVVAELRKLEMDCRIVVLSNVDKPVPGAEVLVGLPSRDTYSLPFAHRPLFIKHANDYDLFIYTEDDTLITPANVRAFLEVQRQLPDHQIAGFLRSESGPDGRRYIVSVNSHFRWLPETVRAGPSHRFAQFSNQHSGCFIATRAHLARAISSGGFTVRPRSGRYGILETAASDIHTQCGLERVICLTRIDEFIVPHLANKYHGRMGLPEPVFEAHVKALLQLGRGGTSPQSLFDPQTRAPGFRWSKHLYKPADERLLSLLPADARKVLCFGATTGASEAALAARGAQILAVPLDPVFGSVLAASGLPVDHCSPPRAMDALAGAGFDAILADDVLHLLPDPLGWLRAAAKVLAPGGRVVGSISNTSSWLWNLRDWRYGRWQWARPDFRARGAHPMSAPGLAALGRASGLRLRQAIAVTDEAPALDRIGWERARVALAPRLLFTMSARRDEGTPPPT